MTAEALQRLEKSAAETATLALSLDDYLQSGETVSAISGSSVTPSGVTLSSIGASASAETFFGKSVTAGRAIVFTAAGGTAGTAYELYIRFTTSNGNTKDAHAWLDVTSGYSIA